MSKVLEWTRFLLCILGILVLFWLIPDQIAVAIAQYEGPRPELIPTLFLLATLAWTVTALTITIFQPRVSVRTQFIVVLTALLSWIGWLTLAYVTR